MFFRGPDLETLKVVRFNLVLVHVLYRRTGGAPRLASHVLRHDGRSGVRIRPNSAKSLLWRTAVGVRPVEFLVLVSKPGMTPLLFSDNSSGPSLHTQIDDRVRDISGARDANSEKEDNPILVI